MCVCVSAHTRACLCVNGKLWMWEIPGSEDHCASHATTNCWQVTLTVMVGVMELQISPFLPPAVFPCRLPVLHLAWANICAKRMAGTSGGNIGTYTGEECVTARARFRPLPMVWGISILVSMCRYFIHIYANKVIYMLMKMLMPLYWEHGKRPGSCSSCCTFLTSVLTYIPTRCSSHSLCTNVGPSE